MASLSPYLGVIQLFNGGVGVQVSPDQRGHDVDAGHLGGSLRENLGFRGQATPATFKVVCANH